LERQNAGLLFDLDSKVSCTNAEELLLGALEAGRRQGFLPYRVGIQTMDWLSRNHATFWHVVREIKQILIPTSRQDALVYEGVALSEPVRR